MMWYYGWGNLPWMWLAGGLMMLVFWGGLAVLVVWTVSTVTRRGVAESPGEMLKRRLAAGEISLEDYEKARSALER